MLRRIQQVPKEVVVFLLQNYIKQCKKKHAIAFLEWRLYFSKNRVNSAAIGTQMQDDDLEDLIGDRIYLLKKQFEE